MKCQTSFTITLFYFRKYHLLIKISAVHLVSTMFTMPSNHITNSTSHTCVFENLFHCIHVIINIRTSIINVHTTASNKVSFFFVWKFLIMKNLYTIHNNIDSHQNMCCKICNHVPRTIKIFNTITQICHDFTSEILTEKTLVLLND